MTPQQYAGPQAHREGYPAESIPPVPEEGQRRSGGGNAHGSLPVPEGQRGLCPEFGWHHEALRQAGIRTQLHCEQKKFKAKISYADKLGIPYVIFLGEDEISAGIVACKDMKSGEQTKLPVSETITRIKAGLDELEKGSVIVE